MRVEWLQVSMEVIRQSAPDLAVLLDTTEAEAGWGLIKLFEWALGRVPQGEYPSLHDLVPGPMAARLIARAAGFTGDPDAYVAAAESLAHPILQRRPDGVRFRGMKRYDVILDGEETRSAKAKKAAEARWAAVEARKLEAAIQAAAEHAPSITGASGEKQPSNAPRCLDGDGDGDSDEERKEEETQTSKPPPPSPSGEQSVHRFPTASPQPTDRPPANGERSTDSDRCWKAMQGERERHGFARELLRPMGFNDWHDRARGEGFAPSELIDAYGDYLRDETIRAVGHPTAVFITGDVWRVRARVPPARARL